MSLATFPSDPPLTKDEEAKKIQEVKAKHVTWLVSYVLEEELPPIKHTLDECYALLAPVLPGNTLVLSTPRNERVKGTVTRVGTRIVKANMHLQLQTQPAQTISLRPKCNIHMPQLVTLSNHLDEAVKITTATFDFPASPSFIKAQLRLLSNLITDSVAILKGPTSSSPSTGSAAVPALDHGFDTAWTVQSCASEHLEPDPGPHLSCHFSLADSLILLTIRVLEPAQAPVALGTKLGLAIGTVRRIEHDEVGKVFDYVYHTSDPMDRPPITPHPPRDPEDPAPREPYRGGGPLMTRTPDKITPGQFTPVLVREKVRVETADPKLMSLLVKLSSLKVTLARVETNLAAVLESNGRST
ncbi:uncharacterized protein DNG_03070 [Cephalotrichum gorgonifer]|uniref:Uncharacterized protein n=1 Tax=Cephalotrichum gorgonifer TaxID=2041049 RepID=A0AAE8MVM1_9PEZI|nr:uncharacterized protein DNG_03070 [Cephalotrichum gorgonifer]